MDTLLKNKDHAPGEDGLPMTVTGGSALMQRLLIRLGVRKGSFAPDQHLGSELHKLPIALGGKERDSLALHYAQEALLPEKVRVEHARCRVVPGAPDTLTVLLGINLGGKCFPLEVSV